MPALVATEPVEEPESPPSPMMSPAGPTMVSLSEGSCSLDLSELGDSTLNVPSALEGNGGTPMGSGKGGKGGGSGGGATPLSSARSGKIVIISGSSSSEDGSEDLKAAVIKPKFWDFVRSSKEAAAGGADYTDGAADIWDNSVHAVDHTVASTTMAAAKLNGKQIASGVLDLIVIGAFYAAFLWPMTHLIPVLCNDECGCSAFEAGLYIFKVEFFRWGVFLLFPLLLMVGLGLSFRKDWPVLVGSVVVRLIFQFVRIILLRSSRASLRFSSELLQDILLLVVFSALARGRRGVRAIFPTAIGIVTLFLGSSFTLLGLPELVKISELVDTMTILFFPIFLEGIEAAIMVCNALATRVAPFRDSSATIVSIAISALKESWRWSIMTTTSDVSTLVFALSLATVVESFGRNNLYMMTFYGLRNYIRTQRGLPQIKYTCSVYKEAALSSKFMTSYIPVVLGVLVATIRAYPLAQTSVMVNCLSDPTDLMRPSWWVVVAYVGSLLVTDVFTYILYLWMWRVSGRSLVRLVHLSSRWKRLIAMAGGFAWGLGALPSTGFLTLARMERDAQLLASSSGS